ncbi:hypothetical protein MRS44_016941 [Fusarium solani]|uniref:Uncharacterized protein n=1 Tax=Fusarium solani TaxID=169388 RepID=A0A9P9GTR1_FUSSL|nr:uncharacterized protein B0J15DRAFT_597703 [Fusarium solani]KAH7243997.1 hypothetical protein B0J15DRAFT_597703 [Fusarium solani]KAJ3455459.1 hypothetical protein MRS44_016941 [Fusarium solani]
MDQPPGAELGRKKRGRPRQYATPQDKANANNEQRRAKRQKATSAKRDRQHANFYSIGLPSALPPIPCPVDGGNPIQSGDGPESISRISFLRLPPLQPIIPEETSLEDGEASLEAPLPPLPLVGADTEDAASIATADAAETSSPTDTVYNDQVKRLGRQLADQLIRFRGCCVDCHRSAKVQHDQDPREHISLAAYLESTADLCPEVLSSTRIASVEDDLSGKISTPSRRQIYCGIRSGNQAPHICLNRDERITHVAGVGFDVDSITGFPSNLAVAKQGIRWFTTQMPVPDLQSDLHLRQRQVHYFDTTGNQRQVNRPVHQIPHYTFGRLIGFEDVSLYLLFPHLYREEQQSSRLRGEDFRTWMDGVLLPVIYQHYSSSHVQHYPSSYDHSKYNATARGVETLAQRVYPVAREQQLMYYLPPESLEAVWASILDMVQQLGFQHFRNVTIFFQANTLIVFINLLRFFQDRMPKEEGPHVRILPSQD